MFNKFQIQAISHNKGPAIVLAGPGSGKTTVITHRIKKLIEDFGVSPEDILVVTFTKAAADNMRERFQQITDNLTSCGGVNFGTFHSIFYRMLRVSCNYKGDNIISEVEKYNYIKEITIRLKIDVRFMQDFINNVAGEISQVKGNMIDINQFISSCCDSENFRKLFKEYVKILEYEGKLDFDDLILKSYMLLKNRKDILSMWQQRYEYILIDEFQDINRIQYETIKLLAEPENNLFIVGDDDQSIYGFRGAKPETMLQFKDDFCDAEEIYLNINYRSAPGIVELSEKLINHNKTRFKKHMISMKDNNTKPDIRIFKNQTEELRYVASKIKSDIAEGMKSEEVAILVRNNSQISPIREFLQNELIQIKENKHESNIYDGMVARDVIAYIRAAIKSEKVDIRDNTDLIYILDKPARLINRQLISEEGMNFNKLKQLYAHSPEILSNIEHLQFHLKMIASLNPQAALTYIKFGVQYEKYLWQYARDKKISLTALMKQFEQLQKEATKFTTIEQWINHIDNRADVKDINRDGINIITMHSSKGLEYKEVFVVDANQGVIPGSRAVRDKDFEEERRLFYVAMTRASEYLNIYCIMESLGCKVEASMFIGELLE